MVYWVAKLESAILLWPARSRVKRSYKSLLVVVLILFNFCFM